MRNIVHLVSSATYTRDHGSRSGSRLRLVGLSSRAPRRHEEAEEHEREEQYPGDDEQSDGTSSSHRTHETTRRDAPPSHE